MILIKLLAALFVKVNKTQRCHNIKFIPWHSLTKYKVNNIKLYNNNMLINSKIMHV